MESTNNRSPLIPVPSPQHAQYCKALCYQLILKPVGTVLPEAKAFLANEIKQIDAQTLYKSLTPLEVHALFIGMHGWKRFMNLQGKDSKEEILETYQKIANKVLVFTEPFLNGMRWIEIRLSVLLLKHGNPSKKEAIAIGLRNHGESLRFDLNKMPKMSKKNTTSYVLLYLRFLFKKFNDYLKTGDEILLEKQKSNFVFHNFFDLLKCCLTSEANKEIVELLKILENCLIYRKELFPVLLAYHHPITAFSSSQPSLLQDINSLDEYYGHIVLSQLEKFNFSPRLIEILINLLKEMRGLYEQIFRKREDYLKNLQTLSLLNLVDLKETYQNLYQEISSHAQAYVKFTNSINNHQLEESNAKEFGFDFNEFNKYHNYIINYFIYLCDQLIESNNKVILLKQICENVKFQLTDYPSGVFSIKDLFQIRLNQEQVIFSNLVIKSEESSLLPLIENLVSVGNDELGNFYSLSKEEQEDVDRAYQEANDSVVEKLKEFKKILDGKPHLKQAAPSFIKALDEFHKMAGLLIGNYELFPLVLNPLIQSSTHQEMKVASTELELLENRLKVLSDNLLDFFSEEIFAKSKIISSVGSLYQKFLSDWKENCIEQMQKHSLPLEERIEIYLTLVKEHLNFWISLDQELSPLITFMIDTTRINFIDNAQPLLRFMTRQELLSPPLKVTRATKNRKKSRKKIPSKPKETPPSHRRLLSRPVFIPWRQMASIEGSSSVDVSSQQEIIKESVAKFQRHWQESSLKRKLSLLENLCRKLPELLFQEIHHSPLSQEKSHLLCIKKEACANLQRAVEDLFIVFHGMDFEKMESFQFSFMVLKLTVAIEQALKLLYKRTHASLENVKQHKPSLLYQGLIDQTNQVPYPLPLPHAQEKWMKVLDSIIDVTGRYGRFHDFMTQGLSQIHYLSKLESPSLSSEEERLARKWLDKRMDISSKEDEPFSSIVQMGWKHLQQDHVDFFELGFDTLKNVLLAVDAEKMAETANEDRCFKPSPLLLKDIYSDLHKHAKEALVSHGNLMSMMDHVQQKVLHIQNLHLIQSCTSNGGHGKLSLLVSGALVECQQTLQVLQNLFPFPNGASALAWGTTALLKEAVLVESVLHTIMSYLPIRSDGESPCHILLAENNGKPFSHSHHLQQFVRAVMPHIDSLLPKAMTRALEERVKVLEPILKKLYRYQSNTPSSAQQLLDQLRLLDLVRISISSGGLGKDQQKELEEISKEFSRPLESFETSVSAFIGRKMIQPLLSTLQVVDRLADMLIKK